MIALVRVEALVLLPAMLIAWRICGHRWSPVLKNAPLLLLGAALLIVPWTVRNYIQVDEPILIAGYSGDHPSFVLRRGFSPDYADTTKYELLGVEPRGFAGLAKHYVSQPQDLVFVPVDKVRDLYGDDDIFLWINAWYYPPILSSDTVSRWSAVGDGVYYITLALAIVGSPLWLSRRNNALLVVLWFIATWSLLHLILVPQTRYHFPVVPFICVLAALSVTTLWGRLDARRPSAVNEEGVVNAPPVLDQGGPD
jgi:hypothetical protein